MNKKCLDVDPDDDSNPGSITMSIEVNGVQYEGILFAKLPDEGYAEPTPKVPVVKSPMKESSEPQVQPQVQSETDNQVQVADEAMTTDGTVVVEPTEPIENNQNW